ncbi:hypothetical protein RB628_17825 [Streptomyces sp. ADMS]|uniref:hypothetical protein n=1 Tax=Streptomyces sp. ADMS TaxID=3071415 RepID=UPI00296FB5B5|nr:hypothetical protein [Streptomyces sp. ADMS]MDW4907156.1 hypothetical protein [Streptomyces sp. ADMS]
MAERSAGALQWALVALALWGLPLLLPATGTGTRHKVPIAVRTVATSKNVGDYPILSARVPPSRRSPYSTDRAPLDGSASRLSRPYLPALTECLAAEAVTALCAARVRPYWTARERVLRWRRRRVLVLSAHFRLDLDSLAIHTVPAGNGVR